jgi:fermentation-respiration switch protein FrsA (DUF1100 family)
LHAKLRRLLIGELSWLRLLRSLVLIPLLTYAGLLLFAYFRSDRMIFQPRSSSYSDGPSILKLKTADGETISARYLPNPDAAYTILFSHGNSEDLGFVAPFLEDLHRMGFAVMAYDYHGYGTSSGIPSEQRAYMDIDAVYAHLTTTLNVEPRRIIVYGRSLGGGVAADLASRKPVGGVVLESTFTSAFRVVTRVRLFPFDRFETLSKLPAIHSPILIVHGKQDEVIPFRHGERLFEAANQPKRSLWIEAAGHNDVALIAAGELEQALKAFTR